MTLINSTYNPTPVAVSKGGTGITAPLTSGQLWIGTTDNIPVVSQIVSGNSGIEIINGNGTIQIFTRGLGSLTWKTSTGEVLAPFQGYITSTGGTFNYNTDAAQGDIYIITGYNGGMFGVISAAANIYYNNSPVSSITSTSNNASLALVGTGVAGTLNVLFAQGTFTTA